ncbi:MAG: hypothetical protein WC261_12065 [Synergistaceae bacterium]|jgi:hypothetical protein
MTKDDLIVGHTYSAKKRKLVWYLGFDPLVNDRQILHISSTMVQYDSPTVKIGRLRPHIPIHTFLKWAKEDVTDEMPNGEWRRG